MYVINIVFVVGQLRPNYFLEVGGQGVLLIDPVNIVHGLEFREANKYGEMDPQGLIQKHTLAAGVRKLHHLFPEVYVPSLTL